MKKLLSFVAVVFLLGSCTTWQKKYEMNLTEVEVSGVLLKNLIKQNNNNIYNFEDSNIKMDLTVKNESIDFSLFNKTNNTIKILWDDVVFIGIDNKSSRVIHQGIRYMDKANPQTPTVVVKQTSINDLMVPSDNINFALSTWVVNPLIPYNVSKEQIIGTKIKIYFPIEIQGKKTEYLLTFSITDLTQIKR